MTWILLAATLALLAFMDFRILRAIYRWIFGSQTVAPSKTERTD